MLKIVLAFYRKAVESARSGIPVEEIKKMPVVEAIAGMKRTPPDKFEKEHKALERQLGQEFEQLMKRKVSGGGASE
jgi:vacuolar-type H+-ATPase catalytic subunit A/Vma1